MATFTVQNTNDSGNGSLRQAVLDANNAPGDDTIEFTIADNATIELTSGELLITDDVTIDGSGQTIDAQNNSRVVSITGAGARIDVNLDELTITGGELFGDFNEQGAGIFIANANVSLDDLTVTDNEAISFLGGSEGGGIHVQNSWLSINDSDVSENSSDFGYGGGVFSRNSTLEINQSTISGNSAYSYGDLFNSYEGGEGGGIYAVNSIVSINNSQINANTSDDLGGGILAAGSTVNIVSSSVESNSTGGSYFGGYGAGVALFDTAATIKGSLIGDNGTYGYLGGAGGGILAVDGSLEVRQSSVVGNGTEGLGASGGGISSLGSNSLTIVQSTIADNVASAFGFLSTEKSDAFGGGIEARGSQLHVVNSTISGNSADGFYAGYGAGLFVGTSTIAEILNSTISNNASATYSNSYYGYGPYYGGAGGIDNNSNLTIANTILADNTLDGLPSDIVNAGTIAFQGTNIVEDGSETGPNVLNVVPKLGPLQDNGGPTETQALLDSSPAIDAADPALAPETDQRSFVRDDMPDIGAFEFDALPLQPFPELGERQAVDPALINGVGREFLIGEGEAVHVKLVETVAELQNSFGWYTIGDDGTFENVTLLDANLADTPFGSEFSLGVIPEGQEYGFFLAMNGFEASPLIQQEGLNLNGGLSLVERNSGNPSTIDGTAPLNLLFTDNGNSEQIRGVPIFHAATYDSDSNPLNLGGELQTLSGINTQGHLQFAFEDITRGGNNQFGTSDNDFNDAVFKLLGDDESEGKEASLSPIQARGTVSLIDSDPNDDRYIIEFDDNPIGGSTDYIVDLAIDGTAYRFEALIDGRSQLIIDGTTLQWAHFDFAAPGRHEGANEPTIITAVQNSDVILDKVEWIPDWPLPPPDEIRFEAVSSIFTGLPAPYDEMNGASHVEVM